LPSDQPATARAPSRPGACDRVDSFCERAILVIVALIVVWGPLAFGGMPETGFVGIMGLTVLALGFWAARMWTQRPFRLFWPPMCWAVLVFLLYALVRCQWVEVEYFGRQELIRVIVYASLFFVIVNNLNRRESATVITVCLIALGTALSFFAVFQFATKYPWIWGMARRTLYLGRGSGTYVNPDHLAGLLGMVIPLALAYTLLSRLTTTMKVLMAYCAVVMLAGVGVSLSRGGIVATACGLIVFCVVLLFQRGLWRASLAIIGVLIVLGLGLNAEFGDTLQRRFDASIRDGKLSDPRSDYWPASLEIFKRHVWWGAGPGQFDAEFSLYRPPTVQNRPVYVHNDYLNTLCEWGVAGMAIIAAACGLLYGGARNSWRAVRKTSSEPGPPRSDKAAFLMGALIGLLTLLLHSIVDFNMHIPANAVVAIMLMALIAAHGRFVTERFWKNPGPSGKVLLTGMALLAAGYLIFEGQRMGRETFWLGRAVTATTSWKNNLTALRNAYAAEPANYETTYSLGEYFRALSQQGNAGYEAQAKEAMKWYAMSMASNPYYPFTPIGYGMCLDWIGEQKKATPYFDRAERLDRNNCYVAIYVARHFIELGDYATAQRWFEYSLKVYWNPLAAWDLDLLKRRMADPSDLFKK